MLLCSCGEHQHIFKKEILADATCIEDGIAVYKCSCGEHYTEVIEKTGHNLVHYDAGEKDCEKWKAYDACSKCEYTTQKIESNHTFVYYPAQQANCYQVGWKAYSECSKCGLSTKKEIAKVHGEMIEVAKLEPTCTEEGHSAYHYCSLCGETNDKDIIKALGHDLVNHIEKEATCYASGRESYVCCQREGCTYTTYVGIEKLQHDLTHHNAKEPTCLECGWEAYDECKNCSYSTYVEIPALGHDFEDSASSVKKCTKCKVEEQTLTILKNRLTEYKLLFDITNKDLKTIVGWINTELKKTVGWEFAINSTTPNKFNEDNKYICIGNNQYTMAGGYEYQSVQGTDYKIQVAGNNIMVLGSNYSLRFGVYGLLKVLINYEKFNIKEKSLGEQISFDNNDDIVLTKSQIETLYMKSIAYAQGFSSGNIYSNAHGASEQNSASMGFTFGSVLSHGCAENDDGVTASLQYNIRSEHNSLAYFPTAKFIKTHPEWYAHSIDSKGRVVYSTDPKQVCYYELANNSDAIQRVVDIFEYWYLKNGWESLSISNMDTGGHCSCSHCSGNLGYQYINFLNKVAEAIKQNENTKNMTVHGMIYSANCVDVPLDENGDALINTADNVRLRFAFNYADYYAGFSDIDRELLTKWSKICSKWDYWTYNTKTSYSFFFFDNFTNMQKEYQTMKEFGAISVADEGYKGCNSFTNFNNLRYYLIQKLTEDVDCDYQYEIDKYFDTYFGVASEPMQKLFDLQRYTAQYMYNVWDEIFEEGYKGVSKNSTSIKPTNTIGNNQMGTYSSWTFHTICSNGMHGNRRILSLGYDREDFRELYSYINQAKALVNASKLDDTTKSQLLSRIELEEAGVLYQYLFIYSDKFTVDNKSLTSSLWQEDLDAIGVSNEIEAREKFATICNKFSITSVGYITLAQLQTVWNG